ncbi:L,D-transpeptidase family protein [Streptomyces sp. NPDC090127]|uniref:L,D-transpeptidase family protein n=1 Tax=Streptomyces sp. NPDC090127 TaxID=3365953 RepID=UPI00381AEC15
MPVRNVRPGPRVLAAALCATLALIGYVKVSHDEPAPTAAPAPGARAAAKNAGPLAPPSVSAAPAVPSAPPGVGPATRMRIPDGTSQVFVVTGRTKDTNVATATLYERDPAGRWLRTAGPWSAHNALRGWTDDHWAGDLRTPTGVFRLGDAGGRLADPGTKLPYDQDEEFVSPGVGFLGEPLEGSFDYVVAIDYNRVPGTTPLNKERPLGLERGGGVWIHVDHAGPTQACVSLTPEAMRQLLRALDPAKEPVIVMGPAAQIGR